MQRRHVLAAGGCAALFGSMWPAWAQSYPDRAIKLYQGFAPGGNADAIARAVGTEMAKALGQSVVVEAQPGAGGTIAATTVARSKPDGYTLLLATGGHAVAGALYNKLAYHSLNDFEMVSTITYFPFLLVVNAKSSIQNLGDLLRKAKTEPGAVTYGSAGVGSTQHLAGELLAKLAGVNLMHVPYRGDASAVTALLAEDVAFIVAPPTAVISNIQAGKLRAIASSGPQRWSGLPDVPTGLEQGVVGYDVQSWSGLMAPAGTPRAAVDRLNAEVQRALQVPAVKKRLEDMGGDVRGSTPEEMKAMVAEQLTKWQQVVADANIPKQ